MPEPGSHKYDIKRARRRSTYEDQGISDHDADEAASRDLHRAYPSTAPPPRQPGSPGAQGLKRDVEGGGIQLRSSAFSDHTLLPYRCSREGGDIAPALEWDSVPEDALELAVVCTDQDAPGGMFLHWLVSGIVASETGISHEHLPEGTVESRNDFGTIGWGGPMPPVGDDAHRYVFRIYASAQPLSLTAGSTTDDLRRALGDNELARGTIVGLYQR